MNRSRWLALGFVALFIIVTVGVPMWKEHAGLASHKYADGLYAALALLIMGLLCIWWSEAAARDAREVEDEESGGEPQETGDGRRSVKTVGWFLLVLSIVIAAADIIR